MQAHSNSTCNINSTTLGVCSHFVETNSWDVHIPFCSCYPYYIYYKMGCTTPPGKSNGRSIKRIVAKFRNCSSKLCSVFCRFGSISLQQRRLHKTFNFATATSCHGLSWSQIETVQSPKSCKLVGSHQLS